MTGKEVEGEEAMDSGSKEGTTSILKFHSSRNQVECTYVHNVPFESVGRRYREVCRESPAGGQHCVGVALIEDDQPGDQVKA